MNLILTVLEITAPVFALACIGFVWVRLGLAYDVPFVSRMAMTISVPCLIFVALMQTEIDPAALATLSLASAASYALLAALLALLLALLRLDMPTYLAPLIFGNTGNVGLPLALFAFGQEGLGYAVVVFAVMAIGSFTFGIWLVAGRGSLGRVLREPLVWSTVLGALFLWRGWQTPKVVTNTLDLVGQMAIPLMLITLGVAVARLRPGTLALSTGLSAVKIALCAAVAAGFGLWFGLPPVAFAVLVLQISTPVAVTSYLLAEKYGSDAQAVAGLVVSSTLLSVAALPLILAIVIA
ncbi:AEC family transporter [Limimaricola cinnabarinus]|uniref:Transporter n=1 Tax=Limimaricola cinnabarinus TaxID=1125964 RepID=A0A2G1MCD5_9RHOB|nr:AEC family transporter [Limimaricola cinnabarinus]PHP26322.1 transporter [Limimaricola cinnabarinus]